jgi:hypothetical protein
MLRSIAHLISSNAIGLDRLGQVVEVFNVGASLYDQYQKMEKDDETARLGMEITKSKARQKANMARMATARRGQDAANNDGM